MKLFHGLNIKAIAIGFLLDIALSLILSVILSIIMAPALSEDMSYDEYQQLVNADISLMLTSLIVGLLCVVFGGYITAKLAPAYKMKNVIAFGILGLIIVLLMSASLPLWYNILSFLLIIPSALLGGKIYIQRTS